MSVCHARQAAPEPQAQPPLWEHFVVVGLASGKPLQTIQGDTGFLGTDQKYKPDFIDFLPHVQDRGVHNKLPPQLPTCCLPAGVDIVLHQDVASTNLLPHTYTIVLTEGDGTKVYASCLSFYDKVPHSYCTKHEDLLGAVALKAICLLSHQPYLSTGDKVLRELYHIAFVQGTTVPLPEVVNALLSVPCPHLGGSKVCLKFGRRQHVLLTPLAIYPPPGELSMLPLVEVLQPDNLVGLFAAVLLEQRVLLRSRHHWLLTVTAESILRLLYPLNYQHVYIPVMPISLTDYLEAPTPFLMGLHSQVYVDPHTLDNLVVVDMDADTFRPSKSDTLLQRCMSHPYMVQLKSRVRMLMQPSVTDADTVGQQQDAWVIAAHKLANQPWGLCKQALLVRIFLEFFRTVLDGYETFLEPSNCYSDGSRCSMSSRALSGGVPGLLSAQQIRVSGAAPGAALPAVPMAKSGALTPVSTPMQLQHRVDLQAMVDHHAVVCGRSDPSLLQQIMQGLPFLSFVEECHSPFEDSHDWFSAAEQDLRAWRIAEADLCKTVTRTPDVQNETAVITIPHEGRRHLSPAAGLLYLSFPALILVELGEGTGLKVRRPSHNKKRKHSVGKRRAISELMGSQLDLSRRSSGPGTLATEAVVLERPMRAAGIETSPLLYNTGIIGSTAVPPPGSPHAGQTVSTSLIGSGCGGHMGVELGEYSAEADIVRRQTALLVQLMQQPIDGAAEGGGGSSDSLSLEDLQAARLLLSVQTGGNGWFLISRLKEYITTGITTTSASSTSNTASKTTSNSCSSLKKTGLSVSFTGVVESTSPAKHSSLSSTSMPAPSVPPSSRPGSCSSSSAGKQASSPLKGSKLFGVNIGSSALRSASPPSMRVSHSMDSFANAAQVMATAFSAVSRSRSVSHKAKDGPGDGSASSPDVNATQSSMTSSRRTTEDAVAVPSTNGSQQGEMACTSMDRAVNSGSGGCGTSEVPALSYELRSKAGQRYDVPASHSSATHSNSTGPKAPAPVAGAFSSSNDNMKAETACSWERRVSTDAFDVLAAMMSSIIEVASVQDDFRVALAALELCCAITCQPIFGTKQRLLSTLSSNPVVFTEWFWVGAFSFAVSSSYLQAEELTSIRDVVAESLSAFARYITGVGITGTTAWLLLLQLAAEHLAGCAPLPAEVLLSLRAHVAHLSSIACQERLGLPGSMPATAVQPCTVGTALAGPVATKHQLPAHVLSALSICGFNLNAELADQPPGDRACPAAAGSSISAETPPAAQGSVVVRPLSAHSGSSSKLAAAAMDRQARAGLVHRGFDAAGIVYDPACGRILQDNSKQNDEAIGALSAPQILLPGPGELTAVSVISHGRNAPTPEQQWQPQSQGAELLAAGATTPACATPRQSGIATLSGIARLACDSAAGEPVGPTESCGSGGISSYSTSVASVSPRSPRLLSNCKPSSPRTSPVLSCAEMVQHYKMSRSHSKGYSARRRNTCASSLKAAPEAEPEEGRSSPTEAATLATPTIEISREGGSLLQQGAMHSAALHHKAVVAIDASNHVTVSLSLDGSLKVIRTSDGNMHVAATMDIPALQQLASQSTSSSTDCSDRWRPGYAAMPAVKLWSDGGRAAIGNAKQQAVWIVDLHGSAASVQLPGCGRPVSALHMLQRNRSALLTGHTRSADNCSSQKNNMAPVYLWDLRQPKRPAAGLGCSPAASDCRSASVGCPGILCLTVHGDGVLAAAGCDDDSAIVWDMRHPSKPLVACLGHEGPVTQALFLPANAVAAAPSTSDSSEAAAEAPSQPAKPVPLLLTGSNDWTARLWDAASGTCKATCVGHGGAVTAVQVVQNSRSTRVITAADGTVGVWGLHGELCSLEQQHWAPVDMLVAGEESIVSGARDNTCCIWSLPDVMACAAWRQLDVAGSQRRRALLSSMAFDPVAKLVCSGHQNGRVSFWNCCCVGAA